MSFEVIVTEPFERKLKRLIRKYPSLKSDIAPLLLSLEQQPTMGEPLGKDCYKIRLAITSKGKGKSGGARVITYVRILKNSVFLIDIYDKSDQESIADRELKLLIKLLAQH